MGKNLIILVLALSLAVVLMGFPRGGSTGTRPPPLPPPPVDQPPSEEPGEPIAGNFDPVFEAITGDPALAAFGFCLLDDRGRVLASRQADLPLIPASTFKTLTAATALERLGAEFRFETRLEADVPPGVPELKQLVLRGGGDPTLEMADLETIADEVKRRGVRRIGQVLGDASAFPGPTAGDFWGWGDVGNAYGSPVAGLNLGHNRFKAVFQPAEVAGPPARLVTSDPEVPGVEWINEVVTAAAGSGDGVTIYGGPDARRIRLTGSVPAGAARFTVGGAVPDPAGFAAFHFDRLLREKGILIEQAPSAGRIDEAHPWWTHRSKPLVEIIDHLQAVSDNHEAEALFKKIGVDAGGDPAAVIRAHWEERGLRLGSCRIVDGSGLSRANYLPAITLARLQHLAASGPAGAVFRETLNPAHGGRIRWKGGAMSAVRCYSGLVTLADGREGAFAILFNHFPDAVVVERHVDALVGAMTAPPVSPR